MFAYTNVMFHESPSNVATVLVERAGGKMFFDGRRDGGVWYRIEVHSEEAQENVEEALGTLEAAGSCEWDGWEY